MTDQTIAPKPIFARHKCGDHIHNDTEALEAHMDHCPDDLAEQLDEVTERLAAVTKSCVWLGEQVERLEGLLGQTPTVTGQPVEATEQVAEWPLDDTEAGDDTNLADLHDINPQNLEIVAAETDDLDARIANLSGVAPTVGGVA